MKYKLAIFDMDGTTLNTLDDLAGSLNYALRQFGFPERTIDEVRSFVGNGVRLLVERGVPEGCSAAETEQVYEAFSSHYMVHCCDSTRPYDGILELLAVLRENGVLAAVVSNKPDGAVQELCSKYFSNLFQVSVGEREGVGKKPCPDSVNEVLKQLKVQKEEAVYIGDSEVDIMTAKNAEIDCVSVEWGFKNHTFLQENGAEIIVSSPAELIDIIL
ncbi:MAG: HAD family hydrolase [Lachnospiraceae bacterium]|nr:HAD family hydrolase [Lachnospiraceae bacterium]